MRSISGNIGNVLRMLNFSGSAEWIPAISGAAILSRASRPSRLRQSGPGFRLLRFSWRESRRPFPSSTCPATRSASIAGTAAPRRSHQHHAFRHRMKLTVAPHVCCGALVAIGASQQGFEPRAQHRSDAALFCVRKESGPPSIRKPCSRTVAILPPHREQPSINVKSALPSENSCR